MEWRAFLFVGCLLENKPLIDTSVDGHVHTRLCHHAKGEMEEYVQAAIERQLEKIIFLEHLEVGVNYWESTWLTGEDFSYYFEEGRRLQDKYRGQLDIGLGVEVGYNPARKKEILDFLKEYQWDRIGVSYHFIESGGRHLNMVSSKQANLDALGQFGLEKAATMYYEHLLDAVQSLPGQVLCHLDAVLRYHPESYFTNRHLDLVQQIFRAMAAKGMGLEVNTSGYKLRNEPFPALFLLKEAVGCGIRLVAGSDAHRPHDVGRYFDRLATLKLEENKECNTG